MRLEPEPDAIQQYVAVPDQPRLEQRMSTSVMVYDETAAGMRMDTVSLDFLTNRISVRDLIRTRVHEGVRAHSLPAPQFGRSG